MDYLNILDQLRRANVFSAPPYIDESGAFGGFDRGPTNPYENIDFGARPLGNIVSSQYEDIDPIDFTPEDKYSRMFGEMLGQMPQRENPNVWRKIAALIGGSLTGDMRGVDQALHAPYYRKLEDWKTRMQPIQVAASDERARNREERMYTQSERSARIRERGIESQEERARARLDLDRQKLELAKLKQDNPNMVFREQRGGNIFAFNPQTGEAKDTGIHSGSLSDIEKINLGLQRDITMEGVRQTNRSVLQEDRQRQEREMVPLREASQSRLIREREGVTNRQIQQREQNLRTRPQTSRSGTSSASNQARDLVNRATELINRNPDYKDYITIDGLTVTVKPEASGFFGRGPDKATRDKIMQELYGSSQTTTPPNNQQVRNTPTTTPQSTERVLMIHPDGRKGYLPANRVDEALRAGWKRAQ